MTAPLISASPTVTRRHVRRSAVHRPDVADDAVIRTGPRVGYHHWAHQWRSKATLPACQWRPGRYARTAGAGSA